MAASPALAAVLRDDFVAAYACRWFYEQQHYHPVVGIPAGADYKTWAEYFEYRRERWIAFTAESARSDALTVLESALLQYPIVVMLRRGVAAGVIVAFLRGLADSIRPLAPRLVYLATPDPDMAYRTVTAQRGGSALIEILLPAYETGEAGEFFRCRRLHGFEGLLVYWREHNAICERAMECSDPLRIDAAQRHSRGPGTSDETGQSAACCALSRRLGETLSAHGKEAEAEQHFATATTMYRDVGMTYWLKKAEGEVGP